MTGTIKDLPEEYDVIVVGTGMIETILGAACARIGKTVLQIDTNKYYGSDWTSFSLVDLIEWAENRDLSVAEVKSQNEDEIIVPITNPANIFRNIQIKWHIEETKDSTTVPDDEVPKITLDVLKKQSRRFNIDLAPKLFYSSGGIVDLLVHSNVAKYCEFKLVSRLLFERNEQLDVVPSSRADIFNSDDISLIDKRLLMKVITNCSSMSIDDLYEDQDIPFIEYLKKQKLNDSLCHLIINSIAMVDYTATTKEGIIKLKRYLTSVGRYGNSPFLYLLYGCGEIPQCFSRLCAVFGGIQFMNFPIAGLTKDKSSGKFTGIVSTTGERFRAKDMLICNHGFVLSNSSDISTIHRKVFITDRSIKKSDKEEITYLRLSNANESGIHIIEAGNASGCAPDGYFLLFMFQEKPQQSTVENADVMLDRLLKLTGDQFTKKNILGEISFDQMNTTSIRNSSSVASKLIVTHGPDGSIDHDDAVDTARTLFHQIYSNGEEFLPRAPDPEDIIIEDVSNTAEAPSTNLSDDNVSS